MATTTRTPAAIVATLAAVYGTSLHLGARLRGLVAIVTEAPTAAAWLLVMLDVLFVLGERGSVSSGDVATLRAIAGAASRAHRAEVLAGLGAASIDAAEVEIGGYAISTSTLASELRAAIKLAQERPTAQRPDAGPLGAVTVVQRAIVHEARVRVLLAAAARSDVAVCATCGVTGPARRAARRAGWTSRGPEQRRRWFCPLHPPAPEAAPHVPVDAVPPLPQLSEEPPTDPFARLRWERDRAARATVPEPERFSVLGALLGHR